MLQAFDSLDRDHRGYGTTNSLLAVLESMAYMPGRKSVVFFSEGLPASPAMQSQLQSVIESANRANITVYAVDASGLRVLSGTSETRREIQAAGDERLRQATAEAFETGNGPLTKVLERTEDLMRFDSQGGLARLAEDTGGFLVRDTNNITDGFKRIDEDVRFHYLLTYSPRNDVLDGKFRTISVKVKRPGTTVYARKGYRAVRTSGDAPLFSYEAPALVMLDGATLPNAFPSRVGAFVFPEKDRPGLTPIVVRVMTDALRFDVDAKRATYNAQAAVVVRIRDANGQVVQKLSQQYVLSGAPRRWQRPERARSCSTVRPICRRAPTRWSRSSTTPSPRRAAAACRPSSYPASIAAAPHEQPGARLPHREDAGADEAGGWREDARRSTTATSCSIRTSASRCAGEDGLSFYFVVYPVPGRCACEMRVALLRNGQSLGETTRALQPTGDAAPAAPRAAADREPHARHLRAASRRDRHGRPAVTQHVLHGGRLVSKLVAVIMHDARCTMHDARRELRAQRAHEAEARCARMHVITGPTGHLHRRVRRARRGRRVQNSLTSRGTLTGVGLSGW